MRTIGIIAALAGAAFPLVSPASSEQSRASGAAGEMLVYVGTYTGEKSTSKGIYVSRLDLETGKVTMPELAAETPNPSFLAVHPGGGFLYAANEVRSFGGKETGSVSGFAVERGSGKLTPLNQESSGGRGPVYVVVDKTGRDVLVSNYGGGSVAVLPIGIDGRLKPATAFIQHTGSSVHPTRQRAPRAHSINLSPNNRFAYAADLGVDKVFIYGFDAGKGTLVASDPPFATVQPGAGPRHFAFHPEGRFAYLINEINVTLTAFAADPERGSLTEIQTLSTLPGRRVGPGGVQHRRSAGASFRQVPLRIQSRAQQHHGLCDRREDRPSDLRAERADAGQHPARLRYRSDRRLLLRRQPALRLGRRVSHRRPDGPSHADRPDPPDRIAGIGEVRASQSLDRLPTRAVPGTTVV